MSAWARVGVCVGLLVTLAACSSPTGPDAHVPIPGYLNWNRVGPMPTGTGVLCSPVQPIPFSAGLATAADGSPAQWKITDGAVVGLVGWSNFVVSQWHSVNYGDVTAIFTLLPDGEYGLCLWGAAS